MNKIKKFYRHRNTIVFVSAIVGLGAVVVWQHKCLEEAIELLAENAIEIPK